MEPIQRTAAGHRGYKRSKQNTQDKRLDQEFQKMHKTDLLTWGSLGMGSHQPRVKKSPK